ncbi:F0F1 ATP synthase subunit delta [Guyparkeria hydrothermalis]|uniref:F0F1 ATP synthase subunit delta n=1 Tax=Guyparkeria hydrothermalis TaxID=923 RepID=UPI002021E18D|nr:F0F1 ATP synthase subunit delta [Guyparkeria hydrothermalis]MCL7744447.1 F0F1 ATP synthase subunit delta [Guyparkeria hydrothermalis]
MLVDWYTVAAQVINFAVLVWLLKRFLYRPILEAIDAREKRISNSLAEADATRAEAERERETFEERNADFERQRDRRLKEVAEEAREEHHRLMEAARRSAEQLRERQIESLKREQERLGDELMREAREQVLAITRRALRDLAHRDLEEAMTSVFLERLTSLDEGERQRLTEQLAGEADAVRLRTAFPLSDEQRQRLQKSLSDILVLKASVRFEVAPEIIGGIELATDGEKLGWSIDEYLRALRHHLAERLDGEVGERSDGDRPATEAPSP